MDKNSIMRRIEERKTEIAIYRDKIAKAQQELDSLYADYENLISKITLDNGLTLLYHGVNVWNCPLFRGDYPNGYTLSIYTEVYKPTLEVQYHLAYFTDDQHKTESDLFDVYSSLYNDPIVYDSALTLDQVNKLADLVKNLPEKSTRIDVPNSESE